MHNKNAVLTNNWKCSQIFIANVANKVCILPQKSIKIDLSMKKFLSIVEVIIDSEHGFGHKTSYALV